MELQTRRHGDLTVIEVCESRIDAASAIYFKDGMRELTAGGSGTVMIDMSRVSFLDSSGLGAIVAVMKFLGPDRTLELAALLPPVDKVFRLTRMDTVFKIHAAAPEAGLPELRLVRDAS